ncbi:MAG: holo-ACP synthase [Brevinema sp.]
MIVGLGTDIIEVSRIEEFINEHSHERLQRIFTIEERDYAFSSTNTYQRFAARFAVKEAFFKAFGSGNFFEIELCHDSNKKPYINLLGETKEKWIAKGSPNISVTLSHTKFYATATVILESLTKSI